jgi:hypothetical protein
MCGGILGAGARGIAERNVGMSEAAKIDAGQAENDQQRQKDDELYGRGGGAYSTFGGPELKPPLTEGSTAFCGSVLGQNDRRGRGGGAIRAGDHLPTQVEQNLAHVSVSKALKSPVLR